MGLMQSLVRVVYPPHCLICSGIVGDDGGLCPTCWRETPFIRGVVCDLCGVPLPGDDPGYAVHCDECQTIERPWTQGRAALAYRDGARRMVMAFKHGDRTDLALPAARWMIDSGGRVLTDTPLVVPIPLHRWRLAKRRFNQAALLSGEVARQADLDHCPDLLQRHKATQPQTGIGREARFANMSQSFRVNPRHLDLLQGRVVVLIDDVMTTGATLSAAAEICLQSGSQDVRVLTLARAARDD